MIGWTPHYRMSLCGVTIPEVDHTQQLSMYVSQDNAIQNERTDPYQNLK